MKSFLIGILFTLFIGGNTMAHNIDWHEMVPFNIPTKEQLDSVLKEAGREYVYGAIDPVPDNSKGEYYDAGMGGGPNQEDRLLRWYLAWRLYGDQASYQNGLAWSYYRATHSVRGADDSYFLEGEEESREWWDNGHNQEAGSLCLWYLEMPEGTDEEKAKKAKMLNHILRFYNNNICSCDRYPRRDPYTLTRPMARIFGTHLRVIHDLKIFVREGIIENDDTTEDGDGQSLRYKLEEQEGRLIQYMTQVFTMEWKRDDDTGFYGRPGEWNRMLPLNIPAWRGSDGYNDTPFMVGHILPWGMHIITKYEPKFAQDFCVRERLQDVALYFLDRWYAPSIPGYCESKRGIFDMPTLVQYGKYKKWVVEGGDEDNVEAYHELFFLFKYLDRPYGKKRPFAINFLRKTHLPTGRVLEQLCDAVYSDFN